MCCILQVLQITGDTNCRCCKMHKLQIKYKGEKVKRYKDTNFKLECGWVKA